MTVPSNSAYPLWLQAVHLDFPLFKSTLKYKVKKKISFLQINDAEIIQILVFGEIFDVL
jgi:hypothetical protein